MKGGFVHRRHDEVRDMLANLLKDVCHDVQVEPHLQILTGEVLTSSVNSSDEARLDISARGFWQRGQRAFYDVRVFNPFARVTLTRNWTQRSEATKTKRRDNIINACLKLNSINLHALWGK